MDKIAVPYHYTLQYGLGDIIREWLRVGSWTNILEPLSKNVEVNLMVCSHNQFSIEFFKYVPFINSHNLKWIDKTPNYREFSESINARFITREERSNLANMAKNKQLDIFLSPEEDKVFSDLTKNKYVIIHPFAGEENRMPIPPERYIELVDLIIDNGKHNVIVVGGSFKRNQRFKTIKAFNVIEKFDYQRDGLINLVNKTSPRLAAKLTINASCFFGNWSVYLCAAWERKIPSIVFLKKKHCEKLTKRQGFKSRWHNKCFAINSSDLQPKNAFDKAISIYRREI